MVAFAPDSPTPNVVARDPGTGELWTVGGGIDLGVAITNGVVTLSGITFAAAATITIAANTALALRITDGTTNLVALDTRTTTDGVAAVTLRGAPPTIVSAAGSSWRAVSVPAATVTLTGGVTVTALNGVALHLAAPTITSASATTVTTASTLHVTGAPAAAGSVTITNSYSVNVEGNVRANGVIRAGDGAVGAPAFSFDADPDTGVYRPASNTISVAAGGVRAFSVSAQGAAVNYLSLNATATGTAVQVSSVGTDADVGVGFYAQGAGTFTFATTASGKVQFQITSTANAVNNVAVTGGIAGGAPTISAIGSDADVSISYVSKAAGVHLFYTGGLAQFRITRTNSSVNYVTVTGSTTGNAAVITVEGTDAAGHLNVTAKGSGILYLGGGSATITINSTVTLADGMVLVGGTGTGTKIMNAAAQKLGFYGASPVAQQTGVAVSSAGIHAALVNLGLITA